MALPVDSLTPDSTQEEIQRAVQDTVQTLVQQGVPADQAQQQAMQAAMQNTQGGSNKLVQKRSVGALRRPSTDMGLGAMGSSGAGSIGGGGYSSR